MQSKPMPKQIFGRLTPIALFQQSRESETKILCVCQCGIIRDYFRHKLLNGHTRSCGCLRKVGTRWRHGHCSSVYKTQEHRAWIKMRERCYSNDPHRMKYYGSRKIEVCQRWRESFENFLSDMGMKPSPSHSLERINNDGNYEPGNCKWGYEIRTDEKPS